MFNGLKTQTNSSESSLDSTNISLDDVLEFISSGIENSFIDDDIPDQEETIENLKALESAISTYGLSRGLLAFADHDKTLSSFISAIPAIESLTTDLSIEESVSALEGIRTTIKAFGKAHWDSLVYSITHPLWAYSSSKTAERNIVFYNALINGIRKNMEEREFSVERAESIKNKTLSYETLIDLQRAYIRAPKALIDVWTLELPKTEEAFDPWFNKVKSIAEPIFKEREARLTNTGKLTMSFKRWFSFKANEKESLFDKGYTSDEKVKTVLEEFRGLTQALASLKTIPDTIKNHIESETKEGVSFDHEVVSKAVRIGKNVTRELIGYGLLDVVNLSAFTINNLKKLYVKKSKKD